MKRWRSSADASLVVESLKEDNALDVTIKDTSDQEWKIQVKQNNIPLVSGKCYKLSFKAKSDLPREIRVIMQGKDNVIEFSFTMAKDDSGENVTAPVLGDRNNAVLLLVMLAGISLLVVTSLSFGKKKINIDMELEFTNLSPPHGCGLFCCTESRC